MIITTSNDLIEVGACDCPCLIPVCAEPRKQCQSMEGIEAITGHAQFTPPEGDPEDDLPAIYKTLKTYAGDRYTGTGWGYQAGTDSETSDEIKATIVANWSNIAGEDQDLTITWQSTTSDPAGESFCEGNSGTGIAFNAPDPFSVEYGSPSNSQTCEATLYEDKNTHTSTSGSEPNLIGCPGPFPDAETTAWDYEWVEVLTGKKLEDPKTKSDLRTDAAAKIPTEWPGTPTGTSCTSLYETDWPTIGEVAGEGWPDCPDGPPTAAAETKLRKSRYRLGVPAGYSTAEHPRSTYEAQWDEVFFPDGWNRMIDDPDYVPPDPLPDPPPPVPQIKDPDAPPPVLVASQSWTWAGSMDEPWSEWFVLDAPAEVGETRVVNLMVLCYRSSRIGQKPTAYGEVYEFPA